jgi:hypothetical protein
MVSRELVKLGQEIVEKVAREHAAGGRAVHLQLLASRFYEALKDELERTPAHRQSREILATAAEQCRRAASCITAPALILVELRAAVAMLSGEPPRSIVAPPASRPQLRVIQGGLA